MGVNSKVGVASPFCLIFFHKENSIKKCPEFQVPRSKNKNVGKCSYMGGGCGSGRFSKIFSKFLNLAQRSVSAKFHCCTTTPSIFFQEMYGAVPLCDTRGSQLWHPVRTPCTNTLRIWYQYKYIQYLYQFFNKALLSELLLLKLLLLSVRQRKIEKTLKKHSKVLFRAIVNLYLYIYMFIHIITKPTLSYFIW